MPTLKSKCLQNWLFPNNVYTFDELYSPVILNIAQYVLTIVIYVCNIAVHQSLNNCNLLICWTAQAQSDDKCVICHGQKDIDFLTLAIHFASKDHV